MGLEQRQRDYRYLLGCAQRLLGVPVCAVNFEWSLLRNLEKRLRLIAQTGIDWPEPLVEFDTSRSGTEMELGLIHYQLPDVDPAIDIVRVLAGTSCWNFDSRYDFWAVPVAEYQRLLCYVRRRRIRTTKQTPPIMSEELRQRLWDNTIGFLTQSVRTLKKYGITQRRGVLLTGSPGNGKTMASRWLRDQCRRHQLSWRTITADLYQDACGSSQLGRLFHLRRAGIIQFDDLDQHLRDRNDVGASNAHTTLLTELDGIDARHGVVYLFTSNARLEQLDPAFRRSGRIDQLLEFPLPTAALRRRLVLETWHADLLAALDLDLVVEQSNGLSFADMEAIKKLLVLHFLDKKQWDWPLAVRVFHQSRGQASTRAIGFQQAKIEGRQSEPELGISASSGEQSNG